MGKTFTTIRHIW